MKALLIAINSSYVHTNPAVRSLAGATGAGWREYHINQPQNQVLQDIYNQRPRLAAFSCYIWNIRYVLDIACDLKTLLPDIKIVVGGPEVSFDARSLLGKYNFIDAVVCGEAEEALPLYLEAVEKGKNITVDGIFWRKGGLLCGNGVYNTIKDIDVLPPPFTRDEYDDTKIYYYESSRGCPFRCAYCLSGEEGALREKTLETIFAEIGLFVERNAKLVKFADRTFNANGQRAKDILEFIAQNTGDTRFHFEVALDLMNGDFLRVLSSLPKGKVQLEAGIQSCNQKSLEAVSRKINSEIALWNARAIMEMENIHLHLDLIAGLPYEDMESFGRSFDEVYQAYPNHVQLGFLKLLKGSRLREDADRYGLRFRQYPPYEVLCTADMSADDLFLLKGVAELVERYYNTGRARGALDYLTKNKIIHPFAYYESLYGFCEQRGCTVRPVSAANQYNILIAHAESILTQDQKETFFSELKKDFIHSKIKAKMPEKLAQIQL